ncbi:unnamed protein product [Rotaria sp. Silwood1]|nr:unnamed protein product [Rotaria sp. Silwood1]CAF4815034.1 unnamed protein product [Rotaria sp. Silwood1]
MFSDMVCSKIFCSEIIIEYLLENYIVWPWDITVESNRNRLIQVWEEMFSTQVLNVFPVQQYPMFIGIMRRSSRNKHWSKTSEYEFTSLIKDDVLIGADDKPAREILLHELIDFKEKYDENEQALSFDFQTQTGLCWDIILEIGKYLTLNDALNVFSDNILPVLSQCKTKISMQFNSQQPGY